jgi:AcrR family transcriptional regulator
MNTKRSYTMGARARAVEETRQRVVAALFELSNERLFTDISLDDVAGVAGVSVQTILRHFGSRAGLIEAMIAHGKDAIAEERRTPIGDVESAVRVLVDHYERRGNATLLMLAQESGHPQIAEITRIGRVMHREWVEEVFAPYISDDPELVNLLVVATDLYTWKLLRQDRRLSRARTEQHITRLIRALLPESSSNGDHA